MGGEFDNHNFKTFASTHGLQFRFACPQTSSQNGKAERMIRRLNEIVLVLLAHASLPPSLWVDALHAATYLHNITPTKILHNQTPTAMLFCRNPSYNHLRVFGCACYPNLSATRNHKLDTRSLRCVFLGYPANYRGYRCLDPTTGKIHLSRHVTFDETVFPFASSTHNPSYDYNFLHNDHNLPSIINHFSDSQSPTSTSPTPTSQPSDSPSPTPTSQPSDPPSPTSTSLTPTSQPIVPPLPTTSHSIPTPTPTHPMTTRSHHGIVKPRTRLNLHTTSLSPIPKKPSSCPSRP